MQDLILRDGHPPSIQAIADVLGRTKQAVLHYYPDRDALKRALAARAVSQVDEATAARLGVLMTGADLPNAFPYFIAIERLVSAGVATPAGRLRASVLAVLAVALGTIAATA